jgi:hypothetical protein
VKRLAVVLLALTFVGAAAAAVIPTTVLPKPVFPAAATGAGTNTVTFQILSSKAIDPGRLVTGPKPRGLRIDGEDGTTRHYVFGKNYTFDFRNYARAPRTAPGEDEFTYQQVVWAHEAPTGVLYVETAHATYAKSSYGRNGYISAIDVKKRKLLWRSPALVANALTFVLLNDTIVSGYGFTAEPDYLYAIDRATGRVKGRLLVPSAPETIARHGDVLTVTTYDHQLVVRMTGG